MLFPMLNKRYQRTEGIWSTSIITKICKKFKKATMQSKRRNEKRRKKKETG